MRCTELRDSVRLTSNNILSLVLTNRKHFVQAATMAYAAAATSSSTMMPCVPTVSSTRCSSMPVLPRRPHNTYFSSSIKITEPRQLSQLQITKASSSEESSIDANDIFEDLKEKWDGLENKSTVLIYGGGSIVAVWVSSILVGAINSVPVLPKIMELVGLGYTGWFVYRYLLFKSSRKELATDIESLKKKIAGTE
ncbi:unnamed protein product [Rhodiola kirilowii]